MLVAKIATMDQVIATAPVGVARLAIDENTGADGNADTGTDIEVAPRPYAQFVAGAVNVAANAQGIALERLSERSILSSFHAAFSFGGLAGAVWADSNNDGCAVARSAEVKALGIKMGDPEFKVRHLIRRHGCAGTIANSVVSSRWLSRIAQAAGLTVIDEFDQASLLDESIDSVLAKAGGRLAQLAEGAGLRRSIGSAVRALRRAGIDGAALARTRFRDEDKRVQLSRILTTYERLLDRRGIIDDASVYRIAAASLQAHEVSLKSDLVMLLPGHDRRGLVAHRAVDQRAVVIGGRVIGPKGDGLVEIGKRILVTAAEAQRLAAHRRRPPGGTRTAPHTRRKASQCPPW